MSSCLLSDEYKIYIIVLILYQLLKFVLIKSAIQSIYYTMLWEIETSLCMFKNDPREAYMYNKI